MRSIYFVVLAFSLTHTSTEICTKAPFQIECRRKPKPTGIESCGNFFKGRMEKGRELNELLITWFENKKYRMSVWRTPTRVVFECRLVKHAVELLQDKAWLGPSWKESELKHPYYFFDASGDFHEMAMLVYATLESLKSNRLFIYYDLHFACAYANDTQTGVCSLR